MTGNKIQNFAAQVRRTANAKPQQKEWSSAVKTSNGTYTVGMTRKQAEQTNSYKNFMGMDFKDIDKDGNGVLSQEEILEARVKAAKRDVAIDAGIGGLVAAQGAAVATASAFGVPLTAGTSTVGVYEGLAVFGTGVTMMGVALNDDKLKQAEAELAEYQQTKKLDTKF